MANTNTTTHIVDRLLAQGLLALREMVVMPRFVNRAYENVPGDQYSTIDVPIPSAIAATAVTPSNTPPDDAGIAPTKVSLVLDQWYEAPFFLNDKEMLEVQSGTIPMQASEAIKALANNIDNAILAKYKDIYGYAGTAGTTPFTSDLSAFVNARKVLNEQLAPLDPRFCVIDPDAEANALNLRAFQDASYRGDRQGILRGEIGEKLGSMWAMDQNVPTHTTGGGSGWLVNQSDHVVGNGTVTIDTGSGDPAEGDIFTVAGDTQTYVVEAYGSNVITYAPASKVAWADDAALTFKGSHTVNLAFHRDAFALAMRPFQGADPMGVGTFRAAVDPVSGLALRLEVSRQHKRTRFSYDSLYGVQTVRPELAVRVAG